MGSDLPLPELEPTSLPPDIVVTTTSQPLLADAARQERILSEGGGVWLVVSDGPGGTLLSFPGVVDCLVDLEARAIRCHADPGADAGAVRHALLDHVLPRMLVGRGSIVLHASGVVVHGSAVLFSGPSGAGKSTLAARCVARGHHLLGDDAMMVEQAGGTWRAPRSYPGLRLWPDSAEQLRRPFATTPLTAGSAKLRIHVPQPPDGAESYEVASVVLIERRAGPTQARRLAGAEAFSRLWGTAFGWPGTRVDRRLLDRVASLAEEVPVLTVGYADSATAEQVLATVDELARAR